MQALSLTKAFVPYSVGMQTGRPSNKERPPFGERLHAMREAAGLSQEQLAKRLGLTQRAYAYWERNPVALRPDQLMKLAEVLGVGPEDLLGENRPKSRSSGPVGKMRQLFESASRLPRSQQQKVLDILQPFVREHINQEVQA
jgi:transcriptional regulator with XRE-family HTH domain